MQDSTASVAASATPSHDAGHGGNGNATVTITVNNTSVQIHRGHQTVAQIKTLGNVAAADDLEQLVNNRLVPLADNASVTIKGEEVFVSHPKDSASSHDELFLGTDAYVMAEV